MKIDIVTAGCGGIGAEITKYLLKKDHLVIPTTRTYDNGDKFLESLREKYKNNCNPIVLSLDKQERIDNMIAGIKEKYGRINNLINCAVCRDKLENSYELNMVEWEKHYRINVFGTSYLSANVAEKLICNNGSIVNISSFYSENIPDDRVYDDGTIPTSLIYASSKAALDYITKYMAVKYAKKGITVNAVLAGGVKNELRQTDSFVEKYCYRTPMDRMARADEFNKAVEFFISDENRYCTGQLVSIDGGWGLL